MSKNKVIIISAIIAIMAVIYVGFLFKGTDASANQADGLYKGKITVGHLVALDMAPLFLAQEAGFFKDEGLDVETRFFANPGDNNAALAGGSIQFSTNPFTLAYLGANAGVPMRIISSAGGLGIIQVVIQGSYGVADMPQLAKWVPEHPNQKIKVGALRGDTLDMILYKAFKDEGMNYDQFEMIWFDDLLAMVEAFKSKHIGILSHIKPYTTDLVVNYGAIELTDNSKVWGEGTPNCAAIVLADFLEKYPETVKKYLRGIQRGFQLSVNDPQRAVDLLTKGNYYNVSPEVLLHAFETQPKKVVLKPFKPGMMACINDMVTQGYIDKPTIDIVALGPLSHIEP